MRPSLQIAFLTGQSDPGNPALSPVQSLFINRLLAPGRVIATHNFPYAGTSAYRDVSVMAASWRNGWQYLASRRRSFASRYSRPIQGFIDRYEHTVFLAGSCGLELFNNLELGPSLESKCTLICYGPVARRLPRHARAVVAQGSADFLSRACFSHAALTLTCGHMGYLNDPSFLGFCEESITQVQSLKCSSTFA